MKMASIFDGNIDQALDKWTNHLFIKNCYKERTTFYVDIKDSSDKVITIKVPKTWFPIDILNYVDREAARKSSQLRSYLRSGIFKILNAEEAEALVKTAEAREEAKRCKLLDYSDSIAKDVEDETPVKDVESNSEMDFFDVRKLSIEEATSEEQAYEVALEVDSTYKADADEYIKNGEILKKIQDMKFSADKKGFARATAKLRELVAFIEENSN